MRSRGSLITLLLFFFLVIGTTAVILITLLRQSQVPPDTGAAAMECSKVTFDQVPTAAGSAQTIVPTEGLVVSNQFQSLGYTFRNGPKYDGSACPEVSPFIAKQGSPEVSYSYNVTGADDGLAPGQTFGPLWLTNKVTKSGNDSSKPCALDIVFNAGNKTQQFSFDILDIDRDKEKWKVLVYANATDTTPVQTIDNIDDRLFGGGDGKATRISVSLAQPIGLIRVAPALAARTDGSGWGIGFDNFSAFCEEATTSSNQTLPQCSDGIDNDHDGSIDCEFNNEDPGCFPNDDPSGTCNPSDNSEAELPATSSSSATVASQSSSSVVSSSASSESSVSTSSSSADTSSAISSSSDPSTSSSSSVIASFSFSAGVGDGGSSSSQSSTPTVTLPDTAIGDDDRSVLLLLIGLILVSLGVLFTQLTSITSTSNAIFGGIVPKITPAKGFEERVLEKTKKPK